MRRIAVIAVAAAVASSVAGAAAAPTTKPAPHLKNPTASAHALATRFFTLIEHKDIAGLRAFLSPAFQVQRADGTADTKSAYLSHLPTITKFELTQLAGTQAGPVLVVRYLATAEGVVNGKPYTPGPAPRLSTFVWNGARWQLAAHANFNPLTG